MWGEWAALLYYDLASFAARSFRELNPRTRFAANWHFDLVAAKLEAVREGRIRRLIVSLPPRHLKSHLASIAFPACVWTRSIQRHRCSIGSSKPAASRRTGCGN